MQWRVPNLIPRSAPIILVVLTLGAATGFAAVSHLVARYTANQQSRGRRLYAEGLADARAARYDEAIAAFRAALSCDPTNSQYQLSLARVLRDSNDPYHKPAKPRRRPAVLRRVADGWRLDFATRGLSVVQMMQIIISFIACLLRLFARN